VFAVLLNVKIGAVCRVGDSAERDHATDRLPGEEYGGGVRSVC